MLHKGENMRVHPKRRALLVPYGLFLEHGRLTGIPVKGSCAEIQENSHAIQAALWLKLWFKYSVQG